MAENKTQKTTGSVAQFIAAVEDPVRRKECKTVSKLMREVTGARGKMWGDTIVGFGDDHLKYASGREVDWFLTGFAPRKGNLTLYLMCSLEKQTSLLKKLGKHKIGKSCLHIKSLDDIDMDVLRELVENSVVKKG